MGSFQVQEQPTSLGTNLRNPSAPKDTLFSQIQQQMGTLNIPKIDDKPEDIVPAKLDFQPVSKYTRQLMEQQNREEKPTRLLYDNLHA